MSTGAAISMGNEVFLAIDIGASSGRVILGCMNAEGLTMETVYRFSNGPIHVNGTFRWNISGLFDEVLRGITEAASRATVAGQRIVSIGVDTWAVDYALLDASGGLVGLPFSYRDERSLATVGDVHARIPFDRLYSVTGLQFLPFNTIYQLASETSLAGLQALLIPDLFGYLLTGERVAEETNASTTGLVNARTGSWSVSLMNALGLPTQLFPRMVAPGETIGMLLEDIAKRTGLPRATALVAVGSHDTASAVVGIPAVADSFAYISSGTWSLVGVELQNPVLTAASRDANFTNERGIDGTIRYLRNVGGLWLLQECLRTWHEEGHRTELAILLEEAAQLPSGGPMIDVDSPSFIPPGGMPERICDAVEVSPTIDSSDHIGIVRCIIDSLASVYGATVRQAAKLADHPVEVVHIVGGGSQNKLLCQLTADATGLPVISGPVEATALGNLMVQARAAGALRGSLSSLRRTLAKNYVGTTYQPSNSRQGIAEVRGRP